MNFQYPPLSPITENNDWMKYINANAIDNNSLVSSRSSSIEYPFNSLSTTSSNTSSDSDFDYRQLPQFQPSVTNPSIDYQSSIPSEQQIFHEHTTSYPQAKYSIDLNVVNDKLTQHDANDKINDSLSSTIVPKGNSITSSPKEKKRRGPRKKLTSSQKAAHNIIEKKYRININTKIEALQKLIPWLTGEETGFRTITNRKIVTNEECKKLNKSLILDKAIEYIQFLQMNESRILRENDLLKHQAFAANDLSS